MSQWRAIRVVAEREIRERIRTKAYRLSTLVVVVGIVAVIVLPAKLANHPTTYRVGIAGPAPTGLATALRRAGPALKATIRVREIAAADVRPLVNDRKLDMVLVDGKRLVVYKKPSDRLQLLLNGLVHNARLAETLGRAGVPSADVARLLDTSALPVERIKGTGTSSSANEGLAIGGMILLYMVVMFAGQAVAGGVVEEKSSRVAEVLLAAVRPADLLAGKVLGIGIVMLTEVVAAGAAAIAAGLSVGSYHLPHGTVLTGLSLAMWYLLGYTLFSSLFAAAGVLVSRQEDLQTVITPLSMILLVGYFGAFAAAGKPDAPLARIASFIPTMTPLIMPVRAATGSVAPWEFPVAILVVVVSTVVVVRVAGRIYAGGLLHTGSRLKVRQALHNEPAAAGRPH